jgi:hypothetical protein
MKVLRKHKTAMKTEQEGCCLHQLLKKSQRLQRKARFAWSLCKVVSNIWKATKFFLQVICFTLQDKKRKWLKSYFKTVKQVASAYGALINNANEAGKGRYSTIFDDGYFKDAAERYLL